MKEKIKKLYVKLERGFVELAEFPFKSVLNSFILAIVVIIAILLIAAARRSFGAGMPPANNIPIPQTRSHRKDYQALALKIYKKVYKLDEKIQKLKVNSGYSPSKAREISKVHKKNKK